MNFIFTKMGACVLRIRKNVLKIPYNWGGWKESVREKKRLREALTDPFFKEFIPPYTFFGPVKRTIYLECLNQNQDILIESYFKRAFADRGKWRMEKINELIEFTSLAKFVNLYFKSNFLNLMNSLSMPLSSTHGDFYKENIMNDGEKLFFIDWSNFSSKASRYFDLIDYYLFSKNSSWLSEFKNSLRSSILNNKLKEILGEELPGDYFLSFAIWKSAKEIREMYDFKKLNREKIKKYVTFFEFLLNYYDKLSIID